MGQDSFCVAVRKADLNSVDCLDFAIFGLAGPTWCQFLDQRLIKTGIFGKCVGLGLLLSK